MEEITPILWAHLVLWLNGAQHQPTLWKSQKTTNQPKYEVLMEVKN